MDENKKKQCPWISSKSSNHFNSNKAKNMQSNFKTQALKNNIKFSEKSSADNLANKKLYKKDTNAIINGNINLQDEPLLRIHETLDKTLYNIRNILRNELKKSSNIEEEVAKDLVKEFTKNKNSSVDEIDENLDSMRRHNKPKVTIAIKDGKTRRLSVSSSKAKIKQKEIHNISIILINYLVVQKREFSTEKDSPSARRLKDWGFTLKQSEEKFRSDLV